MIKRRMKRFLTLLCVMVMLIPCACAQQPEIIVPAAYTRTGTLPVYRAVERDFNDVMTQALYTELFNDSGVTQTQTGKHGYHCITFQDEAQLSWYPNALYYNTYDGMVNITYELESGEKYAEARPRNTIAQQAGELAMWMLHGWPETGVVYTLEREALTHITLAEAKARAEQLFGRLGMDGYVCEQALDMSLDRIHEMGALFNQLINEGHLLNTPIMDYTVATEQDEGYYLRYYRFGMDGDMAGAFRAAVYVTSKGFSFVNICDQYVVNGVYDQPGSLLSWQNVVNGLLPKALRDARDPMTLDDVLCARLTWYPVRAERKKDGMVLTPVWMVNFNVDYYEQGSAELYAVFDAVDGHLINGNWM